jgi:leucyl-tRNA synthetase
MRKYSPNEFETKWIDKWEKDKLYKTPNITEKDKNNKQYVLDMFPYPSGAGLHVGHIEGYTATDIYSRYMRMNGRKVLHPMGWDAFGLPAENYAIKTGVHPKKTTDESIKAFKSQIKRAGLSYDWEKEIGSHKKDYYKWTQWLFLLFYKHGLVYQKEAAVNWCESCKTVLANEQVVKEIKNEKLKVESEQLKVKSERGVGQVEVSVCERCDTEVVQKNMRQWFFKITDYAERLLNDLDKVDWPESTKTGQRNWIGKSEGAEIRFQVKNAKLKIDVFTTRPDTIFGVTYMVLAPEHLLVEEISTKDQRQIVEDYIKATKNKTELYG